MAKVWESEFPHLGVWECHSPRTPQGGSHPRYNCWAFAAGENTRRWEPDPSNQYYWPSSTREYTVPAFTDAYQTRGYELCADALPDLSCEKIAIYATADGIVRHAARQLSDGRWISKLGDEEDIVHETPESLNSTVYGQPVCFMKRELPRGWALHGWFGAIRFLRDLLCRLRRTPAIAH
jgi:hypothetical protein